MLIEVLALALILFLRTGRDTPLGRAAHRRLVEAPCLWLSQRGPRGAMLLVLGLAALGLMLYAAPEMAGWLISLDMSLVMDVGAALWLASLTLRLRGLRRAMKAQIANIVRLVTVLQPRLRLAQRAGRSSRVRIRRPSPDDGDEPAGLWWALGAPV